MAGRGGPGGGEPNFGGPGGDVGRGGRGGRGGGPPGGPGFGGGPGGPPSGGARFGNLQSLIYVAYVNGLGPRLAPRSPILAKGIMENSVEDVPAWGYKILDADPKKSLEVLMPYLQNADLALRERATVALGYMGEAAEPAREALTGAAKKAAHEKSPAWKCGAFAF